MLPMVTVPEELAEARRRLDAALAELSAEGLEARRPALGIMVEVPAAALAIDGFDADFYSIGSNDLVQYVTGVRPRRWRTSRGSPIRSIQRCWSSSGGRCRHGKARTACRSACVATMAADPLCTPALLDCELAANSQVASPTALGRLKAAIAGHG